MHESICIFAESMHAFIGGVEHHACAGVYVRQMLQTLAYIFASRSLQEVHMRACMCSLFHLALWNEDGGVQLVLQALVAWRRSFILTEGKTRVLSVSFLFATRVSVYVCVCVYAHTHTHCTDRVLGCEHRSRDGTPGGPEESRWTKSRHTYIRICVQSTHVYIYAKRRDEILD